MLGVLALGCFGRALSRLAWRWWEVTPEGSLNWDRLIAALLISLANAATVRIGGASRVSAGQTATVLLLLLDVGLLVIGDVQFVSRHGVPAMLAGLWAKLAICSNLSLCLALPLAFLLDEASGFFGDGVLHRLLEAMVVAHPGFGRSPSCPHRCCWR